MTGANLDALITELFEEIDKIASPKITFVLHLDDIQGFLSPLSFDRKRVHQVLTKKEYSQHFLACLMRVFEPLRGFCARFKIVITTNLMQ